MQLIYLRARSTLLYIIYILFFFVLCTNLCWLSIFCHKKTAKQKFYPYLLDFTLIHGINPLFKFSLKKKKSDYSKHAFAIRDIY